jgi:hypothetical protein
VFFLADVVQYLYSFTDFAGSNMPKWRNGIRARLRTVFSQEIGGSSPLFGTNIHNKKTLGILLRALLSQNVNPVRIDLLR